MKKIASILVSLTIMVGAGIWVKDNATVKKCGSVKILSVKVAESCEQVSIFGG